MLGQILRNNTIHNSRNLLDTDQTELMNEIFSCKDTVSHWTNEITRVFKMSVEMYVNKGFKRRWAVSLDAECNDKNGNNVFSYVLLNYGIEVRELCRENARYSVKISFILPVRSMLSRSCELCIVLFLKS